MQLQVCTFDAMTSFQTQSIGARRNVVTWHWVASIQGSVLVGVLRQRPGSEAAPEGGVEKWRSFQLGVFGYVSMCLGTPQKWSHCFSFLWTSFDSGSAWAPTNIFILFGFLVVSGKRQNRYRASSRQLGQAACGLKAAGEALEQFEPNLKVLRWGVASVGGVPRNKRKAMSNKRR